MDNSAHDTSISYASNWFKNYLEGSDNIIQKPAFNKNTMFVSTWDEDSGSTANKIQTVLFGPDFHKSTTATTDNTKYTHYSLLRTIEDNVSLFFVFFFKNKMKDYLLIFLYFILHLF